MIQREIPRHSAQNSALFSVYFKRACVKRKKILDIHIIIAIYCTQMYSLNKSKPDKKRALLKQDRKLFHTNDLALLWKITNKNTLYTTIKRYKKSGVLTHIHKGFYSVAPLSQIDPITLGASFIHNYAYLSTESILAKEGVIAQTVSVITLVSNSSKKFKLQNTDYLVRQMKDSYLYNTSGIIQKTHYFEAILERAVADLLYYNPNYYFDNKKIIDYDKVEKIKKEVGFK